MTIGLTCQSRLKRSDHGTDLIVGAREGSSRGGQVVERGEPSVLGDGPRYQRVVVGGVVGGADVGILGAGVVGGGVLGVGVGFGVVGMGRLLLG
jgi:hypothetical protein